MKKWISLTLAALLALAPLPALGQNYAPGGSPFASIPATALSAANTQVTLTLAAPGAGLFHYITGIEITHSCTAAVVGSAVLTITTTNIPGSLAFSNGDACAVGSDHVSYYGPFVPPIKSSVVNTATTIVCPAFGAAAFCRVTAYFYTAP